MFKRKPKSEVVNSDAASKLADSMSKLADTLERFQDPVLWQKVMRTALDVGLTLPPIQATPVAVPSTTLVLAESARVHLSDVDREQLVTRVYVALMPQLEEFNKHVAQALKEMPPAQLRSLAEKIDAVKSLRSKGEEAVSTLRSAEKSIIWDCEGRGEMKRLLQVVIVSLWRFSHLPWKVFFCSPPMTMQQAVNRTSRWRPTRIWVRGEFHEDVIVSDIPFLHLAGWWYATLFGSLTVRGKTCCTVSWFHFCPGVDYTLSLAGEKAAMGDALRQAGNITRGGKR